MLAGAASNIGEVHLEFSQPNQDNYLINDAKKIYAVFDGHGDQGHVIASYLKNNLAPIFSASLNPEQPIEESFRQAFQELDDNICKSNHSESSGSTCVMAYVANNYLYVAGVGDCTAALVQANPLDGNIATTTLLASHKIKNSIEYDRIIKTGAQVAGEYIISRSDPNKVINMTRAFGDQDMKSAGVIAMPDISITKLPLNAQNNSYSTTSCYNGITSANSDINITHFDTSANNYNDSFLILSSDGLEQVESFDEIARKTHKLLASQIKANNGTCKLQVDAICSNLLQQLEDYIYERDGVGFNDDTTVIVVLLSGFSFCTQ